MVTFCVIDALSRLVLLPRRCRVVSRGLVALSSGYICVVEASSCGLVVSSSDYVLCCRGVVSPRLVASLSLCCFLLSRLVITFRLASLSHQACCVV